MIIKTKVNLMKLEEIYDNKLQDLLSENDIHKIFNYINENNLDLLELNGYSPYYVLYEHGDYHLIGLNKTFPTINKTIKYINETFNECIDNPYYTLNENLAMAKFKYTNYKNDPKPKTIVLDADYVYNGKGKVVPNQHDILAFNINYAKDKKLTKQAIQEITTFANMLKKDKKDIYQRIKDFYPEALKYIRHYKPEFMQGIKMKKGWFWKKASVADIEDYNNKQKDIWR